MNKIIQKIRHNIFETNSSSTHSLTIFDGSNSIEELTNLDNIAYTIEVGEYGWEKEEYNFPLDILSYLWTLACCDYPELKTKIKEFMPNTTFIEPSYDQYGFTNEGYIDHGNDYGEEILEIFKDKGNFAQAIIYGRVATWNDNTDQNYDEYFLTPQNALKIYYKGN